LERSSRSKVIERHLQQVSVATTIEGGREGTLVAGCKRGERTERSNNWQRSEDLIVRRTRGARCVSLSKKRRFEANEGEMRREGSLIYLSRNFKVHMALARREACADAGCKNHRIEQSLEEKERRTRGTKATVWDFMGREGRTNTRKQGGPKSAKNTI
jgi:hypothetical protein